MRSRKTIMGFGLLAAVLFLAVGYAAISNIDFSITGTASAEVDTGLFEVAFDKNEEKTTTSNTGTTATVTASVTGDQSAEFVVSGLKKKNETVTATYTIKNSSDTLDAKLSEPIVTLSGDTTSFYDVTAVYGNGSEETPILEVDDTITLTVTVKMKKTPIDTVNDVKPVTISISFSAEPVQPGSEGSGGSSSGSLPETEDPVYYGKHYVSYTAAELIDERFYTGSILSYVMYEDGSVEFYTDCILYEDLGAPAGTIAITNNQILVGGTVMGTVSVDKKILTLEGEGEFVLSESGTCGAEYADLPMLTSDIIEVLENDNIEHVYGVFKSITLGTSIDIPSNVEAVDVSYAQNGKVMAYVIPNEDDSYDLYIQGDGALYAPKNSSQLFGCGVTEINNLNLLDTSYVVNMNNLFCSFEGTTLDLSNFDTSNVTIMNGMFASADNLTSLDLSSFDTSNVTNMSEMFLLTKKLNNLILGDNFDTSNVTDMYRMFEYAGSNSSEFKLDCTSWNVDKVTSYDGFTNDETKVKPPIWKN